jgi:beta-lactamase regulating signal transducer with metallopeptidase domain
MNDFVIEIAASPVATFIARLTALFALGFVVTTLLRRHSAATRHLAWTLTMVAALLLAPAMLLLPSIDLPVLRQEMAKERVVRDAPAPPLAKPLSPTGPVIKEKVVPPAPLDAKSVMLFIWLGGALLLIARYAIGHVGLARLAGRAAAVREGDWLALLRGIALHMRVRRPIGLAESDEIGAPITWRAARPLILIPVESADWTEDRRRVVLLHEVAHISRYDYVTQLAASAACALYWAHPLAWLAARRMRAASEQAADDRVIAAGTLPTDYATHLLNVARSARSLRLSGAVAIGMARKSTLEGRMLALLDDTRDRQTTSRAARLVAGVAGFAALIAVAAIRPVPAEAAQSEREIARRSVEARFNERQSQAEPSSQPSNFSRTVDVRGQSELVVDVQLRGKVTIRGWGEPRVRVTGQFSSTDADRPTITTLSENGRIVVRAVRSSRRENAANYSLEIQVPNTFDVRLLDAGAEATITDVSGRVRNETGAGTLMVQGRTIHLLPSEKAAEEVPLKLDRSASSETEKGRFEAGYRESPKYETSFRESPKYEWRFSESPKFYSDFKWEMNPEEFAKFNKAFENFEFEFKNKFGKEFEDFEYEFKDKFGKEFKFNEEEWNKFGKAFENFELEFREKFAKEFKFKEQDWEKFNKAFEKFGDDYKGRFYYYSPKKPPQQ